MSDDGSKRCRQKHWSEIDEAGKIERLREELKRCMRRMEEQQSDIRDLKRHQHGGTGETVLLSQKW